MELSTERLVIRPWRPDEAPRMLDVLSRIEVAKWLGDAEPVLMKDLDEASARIESWNARSLVPPLGLFAIEVLDTGVVAGSVLLVVLPHDEAGEIEIGWHLHPDSWGLGYATEGAKPLLAHGFEAGLPEILAVTHLGNEPSMNVCRKLGMSHLGITDKWYDVPSELFRITAEEWRAG